MADETKPVVPTPTKAAFQPFVVERDASKGANVNGDEKVGLTFEPVVIKRSKTRKGEVYPGVKVTKDNLPTVLRWLGDDILISLTKGKLNQRFQMLADEASTDVIEGKEVRKPLDLEEFRVLAADFSARGETIKEIDAEIENLTDELSAIDWSNPATSVVEAQRIGEKIKALRISKESKKRKTDGEEDDNQPATSGGIRVS